MESLILLGSVGMREAEKEQFWSQGTSPGLSFLLISKQCGFWGPKGRETYPVGEPVVGEVRLGGGWEQEVACFRSA